jgi:hypothetical protein
LPMPMTCQCQWLANDNDLPRTMTCQWQWRHSWSGSRIADRGIELCLPRETRGEWVGWTLIRIGFWF